MIATPDIDQIIGADVVDTDGDKVGKVGQVYLDSDDNHPSWVSVKTGLFGLSETLVPIDDATWDRTALHVTYDKARIKDAPRVDPDQDLSPEEQDRLYSYYEGGSGASTTIGSNGGTESSPIDREYTDGTAQYTGAEDEVTGQAITDLDTDRPVADATSSRGADASADGEPGAQAVQTAQVVDGGASSGAQADSGRDALADADAAADADVSSAGSLSDRTTGGAFDAQDRADRRTDDDGAMTRSEERLKVGTQTVRTGTARLRKYVVTEQQTVTVPVTHEEVRLEREPITDANIGDARGITEIGEDEAELVLTEERVVVDKQTVPVERVRLSTDSVTEQQEVTADVRKERIDYEDADGTTTDASTRTDAGTGTDDDRPLG